MERVKRAAEFAVLYYWRIGVLACCGKRLCQGEIEGLGSLYPDADTVENWSKFRIRFWHGMT